MAHGVAVCVSKAISCGTITTTSLITTNTVHVGEMPKTNSHRHNVLNRAVFLLRTFAAVTKDKLSFQVRGGSNS